MNWKLFSIVALALLAYANAPGNGFALDDVYLILESERITKLDPVALFTTDLFEGAFAWRYYRPLVATSFALEHALVGQSAFLYHIDNVLLHAATCALFYLLALRLFQSGRVAFVAAALFAVHPVHSEAVTAISGRGDLLSTLFLCGSALALAAGRGSGRGAAVVLLYGLALLSKESSVVGLSLLCLVAWARSRPEGSFAARLKRLALARAATWLSLAGATLLFLLLRNAMVGGSSIDAAFMGNPAAAGAPIGVLLGSCSVLLSYYYELLVLPVTLSADYSYDQIPLAAGLFEPRAVAAWGLTAGLALLGLRAWQRAPAAAFGSVFLLASVLPLAFGLPFLEIVLAERFLYLPSLGFSLLCAAALVGLESRVPARWIVWGLVALLLVAGVARTWARNPDWRDNFALSEATVRVAPRSAKAQANRALSLMERGQELRRAGELAAGRALQVEAVEHYARSIEVDPGNAMVHLQQGSNLAELGRYREAQAELETSIRLGKPEAFVALYRLWLDVVRHNAESDPPRARAALERARRLFRDQLQANLPPDLAQTWTDELERVGRLVP